MGTEWDNKYWYYINGKLPDLDGGKADNSFMISWDQVTYDVRFYRVGNPQKKDESAKLYKTSDLKDYFQHLDDERLTYGGMIRTARTKTDAIEGRKKYYTANGGSDLVVRNTGTTYEYQNFLGTDYDVKIYNDGKIPVKNGVVQQGTYVYRAHGADEDDPWMILYIADTGTSMGMTVDNAQGSGGIYEDLRNVFWKQIIFLNIYLHLIN